MFAGSTIVFDLDGTLIDTAPDLTGALNHVLTSEGRDTVPEADVRHMVGQGALMLIRRGMAATGAPVSEADLPRLLAVFLEYYGENIAVRSAPFP
ncbi:MAG TPA: phosphoglycolate phosphatase, partial [Alphaproteobacteria bacterium]|nr:phosphoglycolate phosphatase [Alphaproteobacteria bacterium]